MRGARGREICMKQDRLTQIKQILMQDQQVVNTELCKLFGVSIATIRRDLDQLEAEGIITRIYGGARLAISPNAPQIEAQIPSWNSRISSNVSEKRAIARKVVELIPDNCTLFIDSGTTLYEIAQMLVHRTDLTIVTNSLHTAVMLGAHPKLQVYCIGGNVKYDMVATAGVIASSTLELFPNIDVCILSADSFDTHLGLREFVMETSILKKAIMARSQKVIAALDHTKFTASAPSAICRTQDLDIIVTDYDTPASEVQQMRRMGVQVYVADPAEHR